MSGGKGPGRKAYLHEVELVEDAEQHGLEARRAWGSNGKAMGWGEKVDVELKTGTATYCIQAKRRKRLPAYLQIPAGCDAVAFRQDRGPQLVLVTWEEWLRLVQCGKDR